MNKVGFGLSMPNSGGSIFGGPTPEIDGEAMTEIRMARISELEAEKVELLKQLDESVKYSARLAGSLGALQIENAQLKAAAEAAAQPKTSK